MTQLFLAAEKKRFEVVTNYSTSVILLSKNFSILCPPNLTKTNYLKLIIQISLNCARTVLEWNLMWSWIMHCNIPLQFFLCSLKRVVFLQCTSLSTWDSFVLLYSPLFCFFRHYAVWQVKIMAMSRALRLKRFSALIKRTKCTSCKDKGMIHSWLGWGTCSASKLQLTNVVITLLPCWWLDCNTLRIIQPTCTCTHENEVLDH